MLITSKNTIISDLLLMKEISFHPLSELIWERAQQYQRYTDLEQALIAAMNDIDGEYLDSYLSDIENMIDNHVFHELEVNAKEEV